MTSGYGEYGFQGNKEIPTPNIDSIARNGIRFTQGYVSGPYCSPTRAGLMTGRYQTRFGHEFNGGGPAGGTNFGLPLTEKTIADRLKALGYATCAVGKWHLGGPPDFLPMERGFDEFYGTVANTPFFNPPNFVDSRSLARSAARSRTRISTRPTPTPSGPSTGSSKHKDEPFFLYLPFNAQHAPLQATQEVSGPLPEHPDEKRRTFAAMMSAMDDAVGPRAGQGPRDRPGGKHADLLLLATTAARRQHHLARTARCAASRPRPAKAASACRSASSGKARSPPARRTTSR